MGPESGRQAINVTLRVWVITGAGKHKGRGCAGSFGQGPGRWLSEVEGPTYEGLAGTL